MSLATNKVVLRHVGSLQLETQRQVNESGSDFHLFPHGNFRGVPNGGDPTGLVSAVVGLAQVKTSGITSIHVGSHRITVTASSAVDTSETKQLLRSAVLRVGWPYQLVER